VTETDTKGRKYAQLSKLKAGDVVQVDEGFNCIGRGQTRVVQVDGAGFLWIACRHGQHGLTGQLMGDGDSLIGLYAL
jgi:hypothetical protein